MKKALLIIAALAATNAHAGFFAEVAYMKGTNQIEQENGDYRYDGSATYGSYTLGYSKSAGAGFKWQLLVRHTSDVQVQDRGYNAAGISLRKEWK